MSSDTFNLGNLVHRLTSRAFALDGAPPDAELRALLNLGEAAAAADKALAIELSSLTTPRVRTLFNGQPVRFRSTAGLSFTADGGDIFASTVAAGHLPEARDFEAFMLLVRAGAVVVDVGANFGLYTLHAAQHVQPLGRVFAFEAAPGAFAMLQRNIADNSVGQAVTATAAAVGAACGKASFYVGADVSFSSLHRTSRISDAGAVEVDVVTLDAALANVRSIDLLKIDVEGGEAAVLRGAQHLLTRSRAPIVQFEFSHKNLDDVRRGELEAVVAELAQSGFRIYRSGADAPAALPSRQESYSGNLFMAREGEGQARLLKALAQTRYPGPQAHDLAALALLRRHTKQTRALHHAEALQREIVEIADSVVGEGVPDGASAAVRAVQNAWLEARKRALDAEGRATALSASVEGRDRVVEQNAEKLSHLRSVITALETRSARLDDERKQLSEKLASQRLSIDQLHEALAASKDRARTADAARSDRSEVYRVADAKLRGRLTQLEEVVASSNAKVAALRANDTALRERLVQLQDALKASNEKMAVMRAGQEQLRERLAQVQEALKLANEKLVSVRGGEGQLRERLAHAQAALKVSNERAAAAGERVADLRARLLELMAKFKVQQAELARVRKVAKRMVDRYNNLRTELGQPAETPESSEAS